MWGDLSNPSGGFKPSGTQYVTCRGRSAPPPHRSLSHGTDPWLFLLCLTDLSFPRSQANTHTHTHTFSPSAPPLPPASLRGQPLSWFFPYTPCVPPPPPPPPPPPYHLPLNARSGLRRKLGPTSLHLQTNSHTSRRFPRAQTAILLHLTKRVVQRQQ